MLSVTPQGPGFFIFFQTKKESYSWKSPVKDKSREENEILLLLTAMYESNTFN